VLDDTVDASTVTRELGESPVKRFTVFDDQATGRDSDETVALREETPAFPNADARGYRVMTAMSPSRTLTRRIADARNSTKDADFHGCPAKAGDTVKSLVAATNRDARHDEDADVFRLDRKGVHPFGFAGGPHRCLGAHLARREMLVAVEEWPAAIPHDRIATDEPLQERGGQLAPLSLPLAWDAPPHDQNGGTTT
jgi:Cytochrome P450